MSSRFKNVAYSYMWAVRFGNDSVCNHTVVGSPYRKRKRMFEITDPHDSSRGNVEED